MSEAVGARDALRAYKFLRSGRVALFSDFVWPAPGGEEAWVRAGGRTPRDAVHGCAVEDLPYWLSDELWQVELVGGCVRRGRLFAADAGRLVARVERWDESMQARFTAACAWRARDVALGAEAGDGGIAAGLARCVELAQIAALPVAAGESSAAAYAVDAARCAQGGRVYATAMVAAHAAMSPAGIDRERAWQAEWLRAELALGG